MKVIRAEVLGFCEGVRRAVEMAMLASETKPANAPRVYTLGPLIHNSRVLKTLKERGIICLEEDFFSSSIVPPCLCESLNPNKSTIIIRAHGISSLIEAELRHQGFQILDATCPHVKQSQNKASFFAKNGYKVFLAGEKNHGEVAGIRAYAESAAPPDGFSCSVVGNPSEAKAAAADFFRQDPNAKTVLLGQTTISAEEYSNIGFEIKQLFPNLEILHTICGATLKRQKALRELCGNVDAVIIAGDRKSANTQRLFSLVMELGKPVWLVETAEELPAEIWCYKTIGLSAGASAPDELIDEIEERLINRI